MEKISVQTSEVKVSRKGKNNLIKYFLLALVIFIVVFTLIYLIFGWTKTDNSKYINPNQDIDSPSFYISTTPLRIKIEKDQAGKEYGVFVMRDNDGLDYSIKVTDEDHILFIPPPVIEATSSPLKSKYAGWRDIKVSDIVSFELVGEVSVDKVIDEQIKSIQVFTDE